MRKPLKRGPKLVFETIFPTNFESGLGRGPGALVDGGPHPANPVRGYLQKPDNLVGVLALPTGMF